MVDILLRIGMAIIPPLIWVIIFLLEDRKNPEPKWMILKTLLVGIMGGALLVIAAKSFDWGEIWPKTIVLSPIGIIFIKAFLEEVTKFLSVYFTIRKSRYFDEPVDAMIYMITGAMGFAMIENILLTIAAPDIAFHLMIFRFFGAVLLHAVTSGVIGFFWGERKFIGGIVIAPLLHGLFNTVVIYLENGQTYGTWILLIAFFFILRDFDIIKKYGTR